MEVSMQFEYPTLKEIAVLLHDETAKRLNGDKKLSEDQAYQLVFKTGTALYNHIYERQRNKYNDRERMLGLIKRFVKDFETFDNYLDTINISDTRSLEALIRLRNVHLVCKDYLFDK